MRRTIAIDTRLVETLIISYWEDAVHTTNRWTIWMQKVLAGLREPGDALIVKRVFAEDVEGIRRMVRSIDYLLTASAVLANDEDRLEVERLQRFADYVAGLINKAADSIREESMNIYDEVTAPGWTPEQREAE